MGLEVLVQKKKGHGIGFQMGVDASKEDYIIMWGPDGNFEPEEIPKYAKLAKEGFIHSGVTPIIEISLLKNYT